MKSNAVQTVFALIALVLGAAVQDVLPPFGGAKAPILAVLSVYAALRRPLPTAISTAFAAGALADALGSLPFGCSIAFFAMTACLVRSLRDTIVGMPLPLAGVLLSAICAAALEAWYGIWGVFGNAAPATARALSAAVPAAFAGGILFCVLPSIEWAAGIPPPAGGRREVGA